MVILGALIYVLFGIVGPCVRGLGINCRGNGNCIGIGSGDASILEIYLLSPLMLNRTFTDGENIGASVYVKIIGVVHF